MSQASRKNLVFDLSIRVFHWIFAAAITLALGIALIAGEHSTFFEWHMLFGLSAGFLLLVRLLLFVVGSRHVNLQGLFRSMKTFPSYVKGLFKGKDEVRGSHNPLAWTVYLLMFVLLSGSVWTGVNMDKDWAEDIHEWFAYGLLAMIVAHFLGLLMHSFRHRENIAMAMVTGKKRVEENERIHSPRPVVGLLVLGVSLVFIGQLFAGFKAGADSVQLPWIGTTVVLGEGHGDANDGGYGEREHKEREDEEDENH